MDHCEAGECCNVENDEAIAHTLQLQELSQLAIVGSPNQGEEEEEEEELQLQVSGYPQDCVDQSVGDFGSDEYALDGEVGKRLNHMVPVPHVPRINGEIPSVDEATLDHQRLLERSIIWWSSNLKEMVTVRSGEWGDHVTLQAAADLYGVKIFVITSFKDTCYMRFFQMSKGQNELTVPSSVDCFVGFCEYVAQFDEDSSQGICAFVLPFN
ncbi:hypothetical protein CRYUN_Cryun11dG0146000 [Craigia yunnanensis]